MTEWMAQTLAYWESGGPLLVPIALVSVAKWAAFLRSSQTLSRTIREGERVTAAFDSGQVRPGFGKLLEEVAALPGGVAAMVRQVVCEVRNGIPLEAAFNDRRVTCLRRLRKDFILLAALTAVSPLLGLLGTVAGMIDTFAAVSAVEGDTGRNVASGISRALITTQLGLVVALPGVFGLARLRRMARHVEVLMAECRAHMLALPAHGEEGGAP